MQNFTTLGQPILGEQLWWEKERKREEKSPKLAGAELCQSQVKTKQNQIEKLVKMKTTSIGRRPQNINSGIFQQRMIRSSSNIRLQLRGPNQN